MYKITQFVASKGRALVAACVLAVLPTISAQAAIPIGGLDVVDTLLPIFDVNYHPFIIPASLAGEYEASLSFTVPDEGFSRTVFGTIVRDMGGTWTLIDGAVGPGEFTFTADGGLYAGAVVGLQGSPIEYHLTVSAVPEAEQWALMGAGLLLMAWRFNSRRSAL